MSERNVKVPPVGFILSVRASDNYVNGSSTEHGLWECLHFGASKHTAWWTHYFLFNPSIHYAWNLLDMHVCVQ